MRTASAAETPSSSSSSCGKNAGVAHRKRNPFPPGVSEHLEADEGEGLSARGSRGICAEPVWAENGTASTANAASMILLIGPAFGALS